MFSSLYACSVSLASLLIASRLTEGEFCVCGRKLPNVTEPKPTPDKILQIVRDLFDAPNPKRKDASRFQVEFGTLVERYIRQQGLTLEEAAYRVWGDPERKGHMSAYISGRRGKPNALTIKRFCEGLKIPFEEVERLRSSSEVNEYLLTTDDVVTRRQRVAGLTEDMARAIAGADMARAQEISAQIRRLMATFE